MSSQEFLKELKKRLRHMPFDEQRAAIEYYENYFADGQRDVASITPAEAAAGIISEFAKTNEKAGGMAKTWIVLLTIFASPIALPILAAIAAVAFALIAVAFSVVVAFGAAGIGLFAGGIAMVVGGICVALQSFSTTLFFAGSGLFAVALGYFIFNATIKLSKFSFNGIAKLLNNILAKLRGVKFNEK